LVAEVDDGEGQGLVSYGLPQAAKVAPAILDIEIGGYHPRTADPIQGPRDPAERVSVEA